MEKANKTQLITGTGLAGNVAGIIIAIRRKSGFWGGLGWFLVGGVAGTALGYIVTAAIPDKK